MTGITLFLAGPYAGQTVRLQGYLFRNGRLFLEGEEKALEGIVRYLGRCYQAYPEHSAQLVEARDRDEKRLQTYINLCRQQRISVWMKEGRPDPFSKHAHQVINAEELRRGQCQIQTGSESRPAGSHDGNIQPIGQGAPPSQTEEQRGSNEPRSGNPGIQAEREVVPGSEAPSKTTDARLAQAVASLDVENDEHWTREGQPAVGPLARICGRNVTRKEIEAVGSVSREDARGVKEATTVT